MGLWRYNVPDPVVRDQFGVPTLFGDPPFVSATYRQPFGGGHLPSPFGAPKCGDCLCLGTAYLLETHEFFVNEDGTNFWGNLLPDPIFDEAGNQLPGSGPNGVWVMKRISHNESVFLPNAGTCIWHTAERRDPVLEEPYGDPIWGMAFNWGLVAESVGTSPGAWRTHLGANDRGWQLWLRHIVWPAPDGAPVSTVEVHNAVYVTWDAGNDIGPTPVSHPLRHHETNQPLSFNCHHPTVFRYYFSTHDAPGNTTLFEPTVDPVSDKPLYPKYVTVKPLWGMRSSYDSHQNEGLK